MCEYFIQERRRVKRFREQADEEKQAGVQGQWSAGFASQRELGASEKFCHDTDCNEPMMKKGFTPSKNGTWEEYKWHGPRLLPNQTGKCKEEECLLRWLLREVLEGSCWGGVAKGRYEVL